MLLGVCYIGGANQGSAGEGKPTTTQIQNQGYELAHPNIHPIYKLLELVKQTEPTDSKQQDIQEVPQGEPIIESLTEARGLQPDQ